MGSWRCGSENRVEGWAPGGVDRAAMKIKSEEGTTTSSTSVIANGAGNDVVRHAPSGT